MPLGVAATQAVVVGNDILFPFGESCPGVRTPNLQIATLDNGIAKIFGLWDYGALVGYFMVISLIGLYFNRRNDSVEQFTRGGQKIPFWAVGISIMATQVSAIGFMTFPAKVFATNWAYFVGVFTWFIVVPIVNWAFIPFYRKLNLTSAYEYLEARFDGRVRRVAALFFMLFQFVRMGLVLYLPALALTAVTPLDPVWCILLMGLLSTVYTAFGGIEAVVWIEVAQALLLFGGAALCVVLAIGGIDGGVAHFFEVATDYQKFSLGETFWDWTGTAIGVIALGNIFNRLGNLSSDQAIVQRFMTTASLREARRSVWADVLTSIPLGHRHFHARHRPVRLLQPAPRAYRPEPAHRQHPARFHRHASTRRAARADYRGRVRRLHVHARKLHPQRRHHQLHRLRGPAVPAMARSPETPLPETRHLGAGHHRHGHIAGPAFCQFQVVARFFPANPRPVRRGVDGPVLPRHFQHPHQRHGRAGGRGRKLPADGVPDVFHQPEFLAVQRRGAAELLRRRLARQSVLPPQRPAGGVDDFFGRGFVRGKGARGKGARGQRGKGAKGQRGKEEVTLP